MSPDVSSTRTGSAGAVPVTFYEEERPLHGITALAARTLASPQDLSSVEVAAEIDRLFREVCDHCTHERWTQVNSVCDILFALGCTNEFVMEAKARACHDLAKWEDYLTTCRHLLQINPEKLVYLQGTIRGCLKTQRYLEAIQYCTRLVNATSTNELKKWALEKRAQACAMQAQVDTEIIAGLASADEPMGLSPVVLQHSP